MNWLLTILPANLMLIVGLLGLLAGLFFQFIPFIGKYSIPVLIVSFLLLVSGAFIKGVHYNEADWQKKIKDLEAKVAIAEEKSKKVNTVIEYKYITKIQKVKDVQYQIKEVIKEKEKIINANCEVPKEAVDIINAAARNEKIE